MIAVVADVLMDGVQRRWGAGGLRWATIGLRVGRWRGEGLRLGACPGSHLLSGAGG